MDQGNIVVAVRQRRPLELTLPGGFELINPKSQA